MKKFSVYDWMEKQILSEADIQDQQTQAQQQSQPSQSLPTQQQPSQLQASPPQSGNSAFRSLAGKTISGVSFKANGDAGGEISILTKNSYVPFKISWVNQNVTVTDLNGNIINIGEQS